jgi:hypothetical protein
MSERTARITRIGAVAGYVVAATGVIGLVTISLFFADGQPWGTLNDLSLFVEFAALAPLMLSFYELGGRTPTPLAQLAQAVGWISVIVFCATQALLIGGAVKFDFDQPAVDAFAVSSLAWAYIGAWIAGANLLAGPWLNWVRWLGVVSGVGGVLLAFGLMVGGMNSVWVVAGGLAFQVVLPVWAFLMARLLGARQPAAS